MCRIFSSVRVLPRLPEDAADMISLSLPLCLPIPTWSISTTTLLLLYYTTTNTLLTLLYYPIPLAYSAFAVFLAILPHPALYLSNLIHSRRYSYFPAWSRNGRTHFDERVQIPNPRRLGEHRSACLILFLFYTVLCFD